MSLTPDNAARYADTPAAPARTRVYAIGWSVVTTMALALMLSACSPSASGSSSVVASGATAPVSAKVSTASTTTGSAARVAVSKGGSAVGKQGCTHSSCAYVVATTSGFGADVTCSLNSAYGSEGFVTWTQGPAETKQSKNYYGYPGTEVTVTCAGGGQSASGSITW